MLVVIACTTREIRKNACGAIMVFTTVILKRKDNAMDRQTIYDKIYELSNERGIHDLPRLEQIEMYITLFEELTKEGE
jgi:hypothetical protein